MNESRKKLTSIAITIGLVIAAGIAAYAVGNIIFGKSFTVTPTYTYSYDIDLQNTTDTAGELLPGDSFTVSTTVESKSTGSSYMFLEIKCNNDLNDTAIYDFIPTENSGWTKLTRINGAVLVVYGDNEACTKVTAGDSVNLSGQVVLDIGYADYANLASIEDPLKATFTVCGIHSDEINEQIVAVDSDPMTAYQAYLNESANQG